MGSVAQYLQRAKSMKMRKKSTKMNKNKKNQQNKWSWWKNTKNVSKHTTKQQNAVKCISMSFFSLKRVNVLPQWRSITQICFNINEVQCQIKPQPWSQDTPTARKISQIILSLEYIHDTMMRLCVHFIKQVVNVRRLPSTFSAAFTNRKQGNDHRVMTLLL